MAKRFLVKSISTATENNKNFSGQVRTYIHGKGNRLIYADGDPWIARDFLKWETKEYGYTRKCDAVRSYSYKNPENTEFWKTVVSIIEFDV